MNTKALWKWLLGAAIAAVALIFARQYDQQHPRAANVAIADLLPAGQSFVVSVDAEPFRKDALFKTIVPPAALTSRIDACGLDVLSRLHRAVFIVPDESERGAFAVAATVRVTQNDIEACASTLKGTKPELDRGFWVSRQGSRSLAFRQLGSDEGIVLFGDEHVVGSMLDAGQGTRPRLDTVAAYRDIQRALGSKEGVAIAAQLPRDLRDRLRQELGKDEQQMAAILSVESAAVSLVPDGKGGLDVNGTFFCEPGAQPATVRDWATHQLERLKRDIMVRLVAGTSLDAVQLQVTENRITLKAFVPHEVIENLWELALTKAGERRPGADAGAQPRH